MIECAKPTFFVLRTPLLPFDEFLRLSHALALPSPLAAGAGMEQASGDDRKAIIQKLREIYRDSAVQEALWLASPDLFEPFLAWMKGVVGAETSRLEQTLYRYFARMTSRATPFGLFAGCGVGVIGDTASLEISSRELYRRRSRLDMEYLCNLAEAIAADAALRPKLRFWPNTSLYLAGGRYHHAQSYFVRESRLYRLVATEPTSYLERTLQRAVGGATLGALAEALTDDDPEITREEADEYLNQLVESHILRPELWPPITGPEPVDDMIRQLQTEETAGLSEKLSEVRERLCRIDGCGVGAGIDPYLDIEQTVAQLPSPFKRHHLFQVDMMKPSPAAQLDERLIQEILRGVEILHSFRSAATSQALTEFKEGFQERYETREIPLLEALDEEIGIGFGKNDAVAQAEPAMDDIDFRPPQERPTFKSSNFESILLRRLEKVWSSGETVLPLDAALLNEMRAKTPAPLPEAFAVMATVCRLGSPSEKPVILMRSASGPSGANLLGRFCHLDETLADGVRDHLRQEEALHAGRNVVFAEVAHLPEGRVGNVLYRPELRGYEIPYLATSKLAEDKQIPASDLTVSIRNGRIVLRSRRLGCEVLPRLTTAHAFSSARNLRLYRFLCELPSQGIAAGLGWDWGVLDSASFLPRVTVENIVLARARWLVDKQTIERLCKSSSDRLQNLRDWRCQQSIPRFAYVAEGDNQLLIDFENVLAMETLLEYIKGEPELRIVEMFPAPEDLCAHGPEGRFVHEVVIPFVRRSGIAPGDEGRRVSRDKSMEAVSPANTGTGKLPTAPSTVPARSFLPGSQWLFAKIYASPVQIDRLLTSVVAPLVAEIMGSGWADRWFFIRYGDPHWHLRIRFQGEPKTLLSKVLPALSQCAMRELEQGGIRRLQFDSYERELERYGGQAGIEIAERFFHHDSELALELLKAVSSPPRPEERWFVSVMSTDLMLTGLKIGRAEKRALMENAAKFQEGRFDVNQRYKKQVSDKFRRERATLTSWIERTIGPEGLSPEAWTALTRFSEHMSGISRDIEEARGQGRLQMSAAELAGSYAHMHLNRMFRTAHQAQEAIAYHFLFKIHDSLLARERRSLQVEGAR